MASNFSFSFDRTKFQDPKVLDKKINQALFATVRYWDGRTEAHMKHKAPWTDRTTNARNGLSATATKLGNSSYAIILAHSVTYGIYLERKNNAKYAIIMPTIREFAPKVMRTLNKIMDRL